MNYKLERKYNYFDGDKDKNFNISKMYGYVKDKQELDKFLEKSISPFIIDKKIENFGCMLRDWTHFKPIKRT